jgi:hypothetical protein
MNKEKTEKQNMRIDKCSFSLFTNLSIRKSIFIFYRASGLYFGGLNNIAGLPLAGCFALATV